MIKTLRLKHFIFSSLYKALLFLFIVFFLYLDIINWASVLLQTYDNNSELFKIEGKIHDNSDEDIRVKEDEADNKVKKSYFWCYEVS